VTGCGLDSTGSGQGPVTDSCEHSDDIQVPHWWGILLSS